MQDGLGLVFPAKSMTRVYDSVCGKYNSRYISVCAWKYNAVVQCYPQPNSLQPAWVSSCVFFFNTMKWGGLNKIKLTFS